MLTLGEILRIQAEQAPGKPALVFGDRVVTFREWNERANGLVDALAKAGVTPGDRVCFIGRNRAEIFYFYSAAEKGACIAVPVNPALSAAEIDAVLDMIEPSVVMIDPSTAPHWRELAARVRGRKGVARCLVLDEDDSAGWFARSQSARAIDVPEDQVLYIFLTSGSTGRPKGVMLSHKSQVLDVQKRLIDCVLTRRDVGLTVMPMFHLGGKSSANKFLYRGCTNVVQERFEVEGFANAVAAHGVTTVLLAPVMMKRILDELRGQQTRRLATLRTVEYSSGPIHPSVLEEAIALFGPIFTQFYGLTESGPSGCVLPQYDHVLRRGDGTPNPRIRSCGLPCIGMEVRVVGEDMRAVKPGEVGEIVIRSDSLMSGYWRNPAETAAAVRDGWLHSGDLATVDEDGYIYITGRKKELIKTGGESVSPREVEEAACEHPLVQDAAVFALPDELWGERVCIAVVPREASGGADQAALTAELREFLRARLARFKVPKDFYYLAQLPKNSYGKIIRRELVQAFSEGRR